jgi:hypothetical protein
MTKYAARKLDCEVWILSLLLTAAAVPPITIDALERGELEEQVERIFAERGRSGLLSDPQRLRDAIRIPLEILDRIEEGENAKEET